MLFMLRIVFSSLIAIGGDLQSGVLASEKLYAPFKHEPKCGCDPDACHKFCTGPRLENETDKKYREIRNEHEAILYGACLSVKHSTAAEKELGELPFYVKVDSCACMHREILTAAPVKTTRCGVFPESPDWDSGKHGLGPDYCEVNGCSWQR